MFILVCLNNSGFTVTELGTGVSVMGHVKFICTKLVLQLQAEVSHRVACCSY